MAHQIDQTLAILQDVMNAHNAALSPKPVVSQPVVISNVADPRTALAKRLLTQVEERFGLDINRTTADKFLRLLEPLELPDLHRYVDLLVPASNDHPEWISLIERLLVGETYVMRDPDQLDYFRNALAHVIMQAERERRFTLCFWSIGCASGEEAFTLAALVLRVLCATGKAIESGDGISLIPPWKVHILGSDLSRGALARAQKATYETGPLSSFRTELRDIDRFFPAVLQDPDKRSRQMRTVHPCVRSLLEFQPFNLISDPLPPVEFDAILCRNVLVYFSARARRIAQARLAAALRAGGLLLLGPTDKLTDDREFEALWSQGAMLHRRRTCD